MGAKERRFTTAHDRYHILNDGLAGTEMTKRAAFATAQRQASSDGEPCGVFDSMARRGAWELWRVHPSGDIECIERRGEGE